MGLVYRWMQKKDLGKVRNLGGNQDYKTMLQNHKTVANVVELDDEILGFVIYNISKDLLDIISIYYANEKVFDLIIQQIKNKFSNKIRIEVSEYNLSLHLLLRGKDFIAKGLKKIKEVDFYTFEYIK